MSYATGHSYTKRHGLSSPGRQENFSSSVHVEGAHVDDAVDAVGIEGGAQARDADEGHEGLNEQGDASHVGEADDHAAEDDAHPVQLGLHPDDGGLSHEGIFPGEAGSDGRDDEHEPQADAQGQVEAAVAHGGIVRFAHLLELGEDGAEDDRAEGEEREGEEAGGGEHLSGNGGRGLGHDADGARDPGDEAAEGAALPGAEGADDEDEAADLRGEHDARGEAAEGGKTGQRGDDGAYGRGLPGTGAGRVPVMVLPPGKEREPRAELREHGEENKRPVRDHGNLLRK